MSSIIDRGYSSTREALEILNEFTSASLISNSQLVKVLSDKGNALLFHAIRTFFTEQSLDISDEVKFDTTVFCILDRKSKEEIENVKSYLLPHMKDDLNATRSLCELMDRNEMLATVTHIHQKRLPSPINLTALHKTLRDFKRYYEYREDWYAVKIFYFRFVSICQELIYYSTAYKGDKLLADMYNIITKEDDSIEIKKDTNDLHAYLQKQDDVYITKFRNKLQDINTEMLNESKRKTKAFILDKESGILTNESDKKRNISFNVETFNTLLDGIVKAIDNDKQEAVLREAGLAPGLRFGTWLVADLDKKEIWAAKERIEAWFDFDSDIGFGAFEKNGFEQNDFISAAFAPSAYKIGTIVLKNNFLLEKSTSDMIVYFMLGYIEGILKKLFILEKHTKTSIKVSHSNTEHDSTFSISISEFGQEELKYISDRKKYLKTLKNIKD